MNIRNVPSGTVVATPHQGYEHVGILGESDLYGHATVISASRQAGKVVEQPFDLFSRGNDARVLGYPSQLAPSAVLMRARARLGTQYDLLYWNCEHFACYAHGIRPTSPQLFRAVLLGVLSLALVIQALRSR